MVYVEERRAIIMALTSRNYSSFMEDYTVLERTKKRQKPPEMRKSFVLTEIHDIHHEIARRVVLGQKPKDIAKALDISYQTVINTKNAPVVREQVAIMSGARDNEVVDVAKQIQALVPKAIQALNDVFEADTSQASLALKARTAKDALAIAGHGPQKNVNVRGVHAILTSDDLSRIRQRAMEIGMIGGIIE